jgi:hypothetical protein
VWLAEDSWACGRNGGCEGRQPSACHYSPHRCSVQSTAWVGLRSLRTNVRRQCHSHVSAPCMRKRVRRHRGLCCGTDTVESRTLKCKPFWRLAAITDGRKMLVPIAMPVSLQTRPSGPARCLSLCRPTSRWKMELLQHVRQHADSASACAGKSASCMYQHNILVQSKCPLRQMDTHFYLTSGAAILPLHSPNPNTTSPDSAFSHHPSITTSSPSSKYPS